MSRPDHTPAQLRRLIGVAVLFAAFLLVAPGVASAATKFPTPTNSSPIQVSANARFVWSVNPGTDSVSVIRADTNAVIANIKVGDEPESIAIDPANKYVYVANTAAGTVTVIRITNQDRNNFKAKVDKRIGKKGVIQTGAEPWDIVISPDARRVFVANSNQDTVSVIDATETVKKKKLKNGKTKTTTTLPHLIGSVELRGTACSPDKDQHFQPRGLAVPLDNKKVYVTAFFSFQLPGVQQVNDAGRRGIVCRITYKTKSAKIKDYKPSAAHKIFPEDTGFTVDKTGDGVADPVGAWPNQMQSIVVRGDQAFMPNVAASPEGPQRFNNSTMAFVNVLDGAASTRQTDGSKGKFVNLHLGARTPEAGKKKLFFANPWAIAFTNQSGVGNAYVVSAASDVLVKLNVDGNGVLSFTGGAATTRYIDLNDPANPKTAGDAAGKNPQGVAINKDGNRAYVQNFVSGNVTIVDLKTDSVIGAVRTSPLPAPGSPEEVVRVGAEMFFSSRGHFDKPAGTTTSSDERLSSDAWQSCSSCHFKGLTDSVVWAFGTGPRKSLPLNASFNPHANTQQKILNYSAVNDELEDFELNIRNVSGPGALATAQACQTPPPATSAFDPNHGLLIGDNGDFNVAPCVINAIPLKANSGRPQQTVTLPGSSVHVPAWEGLREWTRKAIRTPNPPTAGLPGALTPSDVQQGSQLFNQQGCQNCHAGTLFSKSVKDYTSPPGAADIGNERTGTFTGNPVAAPYVAKFITNIGSFNLGVPGGNNPLGANIGGTEKTTSVLQANGASSVPFDALGFDYNGDGKGSGYTVPSLLGIDASPPYYHNGACETLACVLSNPKHRTANGTVPDVLGNPADQAKVVAFLRSIK